MRKGAIENATVARQLLEDLQERGLDFSVPRLYVLDGGKALSSAVRKFGRTVRADSTLSSSQDSQRR